MITALSTPESGRIILDANTTLIKVQSDNGEGYYFRAKIYINGELFDEQGWSRSDAYTATKDLKKLYNAYFSPVFNPAFANLLTEQTHLKHLVAITVEEYNIDTGAFVQSIALPPFYIMHNVKPAAFNDVVPLTVLGLDAGTTIVPVNGKIAFSFYVNQSSGNVRVRLLNNFGTVIDDRSVNGVSGKKVFLYQFNLAGVAFSYNTLWLTAEVYGGGGSLFKKPIFRLNRLPDHPVKEIAYLNNFGFFQYAYFDGEMEIENGFTPETYDTADGTKKVYEINEEATYTINTGSLLKDEKPVMNMVANSHDVRLKNGTVWLPIVTKIKKQLEYKDRQNSYAENLQFTIVKGTDIANTGMISIESPVADIVITDTVVNGSTITVHFELNNGYSPPAIAVRYRIMPAGPWINTTGSTLSPRTLNVPPGTYELLLVDSGGIAPVSEVETITV